LPTSSNKSAYLSLAKPATAKKPPRTELVIAFIYNESAFLISFPDAASSAFNISRLEKEKKAVQRNE
jgi:hypothetical protein